MYKGSSRQPIKKCSKGRVLGIFEQIKFNENSNFESDSKFQQCYDTKNAILANLAFLSVDMDNLLVGEFSLQVRNFSHNFFCDRYFEFQKSPIIVVEHLLSCSVSLFLYHPKFDSKEAEEFYRNSFMEQLENLDEGDVCSR